MLCESKKVKDPMKVGRFGLGFKSVFHVTGTYVFTDRKMGSYFFLLIEKLATTKHALISIYTPIHSKMAKSEAIIKE